MKNLWLAIIFLAFVSACNKKKHSEHLAANEYYTCSMDPQVMEKQPGNCPICKMKLTKVTINKSEEGKMRFSETQIKLANIQVDTVRVRSISEELRISARVDLNQNENTVISSRVSGRIEKLNFKNTGELIKKGDVLFEIYSEQLSAAQQDYLLALQRSQKLKGAEINYSALAESAKNKLLLWGMNEMQLKQVEETQKIFESTPVISKVDGIVTEVKIREGDYAGEGEAVIELNTMNSVWVLGQLYSVETAKVKEGDMANVKVFEFTDKEFTAPVSYIQPELNSDSKILPLRLELKNTGFALKPGMAANIFVSTRKKQAMVLPLDAVLQFSGYKTVWVQNPDGSFETRMVEAGITNSREIEITSGIKEGELVVISGAYLIQSDYQFKKGANPMEGHKM